MQLRCRECFFPLNFRVTKSFLFRSFIVLFAILPIIESLNGFLNNGGNASGFSLGILYRLILIVVSTLIILTLGFSRRTVIVAFFGITVLFLPHVMELLVVRPAKGDASFPALWLKTAMPFICIEAYILLRNKTDFGQGLCEKLLTIWSYLVPILILIPFVIGIGFETYADSSVGYKGFFYSQNDLAFMLTVLYIFSFEKMLRIMRLSTFLPVAGLLFCIVLLGLKSTYILFALASFYLLFSSTAVSRKRKLIITLAFVVALIILAVLFFDQLSSIVARWRYFAQSLGSFPRFITSARIDRVPAAFEYACSTFDGLGWLVFGTGMEYSVALGSYALIEMDFFDLVFLFGISGLLLYIAYFSSICCSYLSSDRRCDFLEISLLAAIALASLAGHVLVNSALSAMVLSTIFFGMVDKTEGVLLLRGEKIHTAGKHFKEGMENDCARKVD